MSIAPARPSTRLTAPRATPETVAAYFAAGHSTAEAVAYFGVSDSYLRRLKRMASDRNRATVAQLINADHDRQSARTLPCIEDRPSSVVARHARIYDSPRLVYHAAIARGHELWWCKRCNDYMHPLPGTTGKDWNECGCYLHAAEPEPVPEPAPATVKLVPEPEPRLSVSQSQRNTEPEQELRAAAHTVPHVPELPTYHKVPSTAEALPPSPIVVRQIVRVPVEARRGGLVEWLAACPMIGPIPVWSILLLAVLLLVAGLG